MAKEKPVMKNPSSRSRRLVLGLAAGMFLAAACSSTPAPLPPSVETGPAPAATSTETGPTPPAAEWKDLFYAAVSPAQALDLYLPAGNGPFPLLIYVHGGGFRQGDKNLPAARGILDVLLQDGYAVASLNYRLSGEAKFPAAIQDVKTAVRWLRAHADVYRLDPGRFGAWGDSAGANLVALLGTSCGIGELEGAELGNPDQSSCVQAVVDFYGPIDFLQMDAEFGGTDCPINHDRPNSAESQYVGGPVQQNQSAVKAANPISYISPDDPPFLIQHGAKDCTVPQQQSQLFYDALAPAIGADKVTLTYLDGADHGDKQFVSAPNLQAVLDFLDRYLKP
jgi:acetyl esterase/lipase